MLKEEVIAMMQAVALTRTDIGIILLVLVAYIEARIIIGFLAIFFIRLILFLKNPEVS